MSGWPSLAHLLLQGLLTAVIVLVPAWIFVFGGGRLKTSGTEVLMALATFPILAAVSVLVFVAFEGKWADAPYTALDVARAMLVGALALSTGMAVTQWRQLARRPGSEAAIRVGATFLMGALWGLVWAFAGGFLQLIGV